MFHFIVFSNREVVSNVVKMVILPEIVQNVVVVVVAVIEEDSVVIEDVTDHDQGHQTAEIMTVIKYHKRNYKKLFFFLNFSFS